MAELTMYSSRAMNIQNLQERTPMVLQRQTGVKVVRVARSGKILSAIVALATAAMTPAPAHAACAGISQFFGVSSKLDQVFNYVTLTKLVGVNTPLSNSGGRNLVWYGNIFMNVSNIQWGRAVKKTLQGDVPIYTNKNGANFAISGTTFRLRVSIDGDLSLQSLIKNSSGILVPIGGLPPKIALATCNGVSLGFVNGNEVWTFGFTKTVVHV